MTEPNTPRRPRGLALDGFRRELMLTNFELWVAYFALGGTAPLDVVVSYLVGDAGLSDTEHNTLAVALNESFLDAGGDHPVPYIG